MRVVINGSEEDAIKVLDEFTKKVYYIGLCKSVLHENYSQDLLCIFF